MGEFDTYLIVTGPNGERFTDDDGGEGLNSALTLSNPSNGVWTITVTSFGGFSTGAYSLNVTIDGGDGDGGGGSSGEPGFAPMEGSLTETDDDEDGRYFDEISYTATGDMPLVIDLTSDDFDTFLIAISPDGVEYSDDDSGEGLNSSLTIENPAAGEWTIVVTTFSAGATGAYELSIEG